MERTRLIYLHQRFLSRMASDDEIQEFRDILNNPESEKILNSLADEDWEVTAQNQVARPRNYESIFEQIIASPQERKRPLRIWGRIAIAAAVAAVVFGVGLFYFNKYMNQNLKQVSFANDIAPGKQGATLILANGKKIRLADAKNGVLAKEAGISISKTADGQIVYKVNENNDNPIEVNSLTTARGETYQLRLPDGSQVWLNSASSLTYMAVLSGHGPRRVKLQGEAYFQVTKDKTHPFIVETSKQEVVVLGTHFNINSYADEPVTVTTLLEGAVKVSSGASREILKPGQQSTLNDSGKISVNQVDVDNAVAWKNGYFQFENENLESIMRKVSRWYDVDVFYQDNDLKTLAFMGTVSKYKNVTQLLKTLQLTNELDFKIEDKTIFISAHRK